MKLVTLLERLAKKAGVDTTLLALPATINDVEVPDDIAGGIDKALLTLEAAKVNPEIRKAARAEVLDGVDKKVAEVLTELGIEDFADITDEKNSFEKIKKLTLKVKDLESKKASSSKNTDKEAIEKQIAELNQQLKDAKATLTQKQKEFDDTRNADLTDFELQKILLGKDYALPKDMDAELKIITAKSAVQRALAEKGYKLVRDENGQMKILNKENLPAYSETNEPIQLGGFVDGALARNKLLKVNDQSQGNNGSGDNGQNNQIISGSGGFKGNQQTANAIDQQMKELGLAS